MTVPTGGEAGHLPADPDRGRPDHGYADQGYPGGGYDPGYETYGRAPTDDERSLGDLFGELTTDLGTLMRSELELAKVELKDEAAKAGRAGGLLAGGALAAYLAAILLAFAAAWGLAEVVEPGWAFLIVGIVVAIVAAALGLAGRDRLARLEPMPHQTMETLQEDARWARAQVK